MVETILPTQLEFALGYEGSNWFVQGGPVVTAPDAGTNDTDFLATGGSVALSESVVGYGELSFQTDDVDNDYGVKVLVLSTFSK